MRNIFRRHHAGKTRPKKLTEGLAKDIIYYWFQSELSMSAIASRLGVRTKAVRQVVVGELFYHIPRPSYVPEWRTDETATSN